jgi:cytochrome c-type biogenesis protein
MTYLVFAFGAGMLAPVNPCGFAVLPAFFAYYLADQDDAGGGSVRAKPLAAQIGHGFLVGLAVSAGFAGVFTLTGLLVSAGLRSLVTAVPWAAAAIGAVLVLLGALLLAGRQIRIPTGHGLQTGKSTGYRGLVLFGAAYAVASLSCTLAVLLAVVAQAAATANPLQLLAVFAAYGAGAASILVALALAAALAKETLARRIRSLLPAVTRLGGGVLALSGLYLILYWVPALTGQQNTFTTGLPPASVSAQLTGWLSENQGPVAAVTLLLAAAGAVVTARGRMGRRSPGRERDQAEDCCAEPGGAPGAPGATAPKRSV